jgi:periplasmic mercuric ion binding protein
MKKIAFIITLGFITASCNRIEKETRVLIQDKDDAVLVVNIPQASCPKCQKVMEGGLANTEGIKQSILNLNTKQVSVVYNPNITNAKAIETSINELIPQMPCK